MPSLPPAHSTSLCIVGFPQNGLLLAQRQGRGPSKSQGPAGLASFSLLGLASLTTAAVRLAPSWSAGDQSGRAGGEGSQGSLPEPSIPVKRKAPPLGQKPALVSAAWKEPEQLDSSSSSPPQMHLLLLSAILTMLLKSGLEELSQGAAQQSGPVSAAASTRFPASPPPHPPGTNTWAQPVLSLMANVVVPISLPPQLLWGAAAPTQLLRKVFPPLF